MLMLSTLGLLLLLESQIISGLLIRQPTLIQHISKRSARQNGLDSPLSRPLLLTKTSMATPLRRATTLGDLTSLICLQRHMRQRHLFLPPDVILGVLSRQRSLVRPR